MKSQTKGAAMKRPWQLWQRLALAMASLGLTRRLHEQDTQHSTENHECSTENHEPKEKQT